MRIAIATGGRFHVLDLARELAALGHDVRFYSYVPRERAARFGLPERCHVGLLPILFPVVGWERLRPRLLPAWRERAMCLALDRAIMARLAPCDVFIGMSGLILEAARYARRRFGARIYLERGSRHILSQRDILAGIPGAEGPSDFAVARELAGYALADRIAVPSSHVVESFRERDEAVAPKLFVNPYGVDLEQFPLRTAREPGPPTVVFAGAWSLRKGADVLAEAIRLLHDVELHHVGPIVDVAFPVHPRMRHHAAAPQWQLSDHYAQADVFAIASHEEGLALVQAQALASGLPLVCTDRSGGFDLGHTPALAQRIRVVPHGDPRTLADGIARMMAAARTDGALPAIGAPDRECLTWREYGRRYDAELRASLSAVVRSSDDHRGVA